MTPNVPKGKKVVSIASNAAAFAAIFEDGTVQCWGDQAHGGKTPDLPQGKKVQWITGMDVNLNLPYSSPVHAGKQRGVLH